MKKIVIRLGLLMVSLGVFSEQVYATKDYVYIPNDGLRKDINQLLGMFDMNVENELPDSTMFDKLNSINTNDENNFQQLFKLYVSGDSAGSLEGVQNIKHLNEIFINTGQEGNEVIDFRPLKDLHDLKNINSYSYKLDTEKPFSTDLSPLENLEKLERIELNGGHFLDLTPLEKSVSSGNLRVITLDSGGYKVLNLDSISIAKNQNSYELVSPVKYPSSFKTIPGIDYSVEAYYTEDPISYFDEMAGVPLTSTLDNGIIKFSDLPDNKSNFNYLAIKIGASYHSNSERLSIRHSISISYPVHFY